MKPAKSILVIDDEDSICFAFKRFFEKRGWTVHTAASANDGRGQYREHQPAVVFLDVRLPDESGLDLLEEFAEDGAHVVVITAYGGLDTVVLAIQGKAHDYLAKPLDLDKALAVADNILQVRRSESREAESEEEQQSILVGKAPAMQEIYKLIARAASTDSPVLIDGETGTGKELAAKAIHHFSPRRDGPFVTVNCGAIPENLIESELFGHIRGAFTGAGSDRTGRFESAQNGTLLLDEVGELPLASQVKLLRVLDNNVVERVGSSQSIRLNVRIIAATNRNLMDEVNRGGFRRDLYYRLAVLSISLPPLRSRREDIPLLASHFLSASSDGKGSHAIGPAALEALLGHRWPGNVRELKNAIEHALAIAPERPITVEDLPLSVRIGDNDGGNDDAQLRTLIIEHIRHLDASVGERYRSLIGLAEQAMIEYALERFRGNQSEAAEYLGLHRNTLRNKIRELGIALTD